ncbi:DNA cytosine methyltransferase [Desulfofundulus salinus]|uniref:DNA (cytosine-5-)-methyltransferase n=1 Tax=Desulfofundulus salinus TaxID=2419843 RepID=A0A494WW15_9FIRM|nr:DNA cytosine methyltransferase [Desulfofundulus salinum]RKO66432.1 DNA cytosine methyltransferase [Desulfofundulus salinum]
MAVIGPLTFYEFFAGAGLVRLGLGEAWRCVWANDIDPKKAEVYIHNFGPDELTVCDVAEVDPSSLPSKADMAWASFPCQDLSLAGWRRGMSAERSGTFWAFWRIMRDLHDRGDMPPMVVLENVVGLLYDDDFPGLCEALAALDLQFGALVIDAKHFLPQSRPRVFIVGVKADIDVEPFLTQTTEGSPWTPKALLAAHAKLSPSLRGLWRWWKLPAPSFPVPSLADLIEENPSVDWNTQEETQKLLEIMSPSNRQKIEKALSSGGRWVGTLYKRTRNGVQRAEARFDGIAGCLRTPQGGSSRQTVLIVDKGEVKSRLLSPREAARLMGAPDTFWLPDRYNDAYRAMGDAVAVPVVSWLSRQLLIPLALTAQTASRQQSPRKGDRWSIRYRLTAERLASEWRSARQ